MYGVCLLCPLYPLLVSKYRPVRGLNDTKERYYRTELSNRTTYINAKCRTPKTPFCKGVTRDDLQRRFLTQHIISTLLRHCCEWLQHCYVLMRKKSPLQIVPCNITLTDPVKPYLVKKCRTHPNESGQFKSAYFYNWNCVAVPQGDVTRDDLHRRFSAQHSVVMLEQCCNDSRQCCNNAVILCCVKNCRCKSSLVTSYLTHSGERFEKDAAAVSGFIGFVWTESRFRFKKTRFQKYPGSN